MQADAYSGFGKLYDAHRSPDMILEAGFWAHGRRLFFVLADVAASARRKAQSKTPAFISPIALKGVRRINALFEVERAINGRGADQRLVVRQVQSASLVETCKLNGVDPQAYFTDLLEKLVNLWSASRLGNLMPWAWAKLAA